MSGWVIHIEPTCGTRRAHTTQVTPPKQALIWIFFPPPSYPRMTDKPRLIEVAFPLRQASVASVHEKNVRHGHISTLHIWPARRPLAACRAALLATLLPDPGDPEKRQALLDAIGGRVVTEYKESLDEDGQRVVEEKDVVKDGVLAWGQENTEMMETFRRQIREFYGGKAPRVLDPFAGGGAIPLEAMRLGCEVTASDLNPVAWFILKCTLDYPQRFAGKTWPLPDFVREWPDLIEDFQAGKVKTRKGGKKAHFTDTKQLELLELPPANLAWHIRAWGRWVFERARQDLASRYPVINGEPTVAYLWARTARDKSEPFARIPLLKTFWLCKKRGRRCALVPVPAEDNKSVEFRLLEEAFFQQDKNEWGRLLRESFPHLRIWGIDGETLIGFLDRGTMNRAGVWSPCSGRPTTIALTMEDLRFQGKNRLLETQMTAVVVEKTEVLVTTDRKGRTKTTYKTKKLYRLPDPSEINAAQIEVEDIERVFENIPFGIPNEPTPAGGGSGAARAFSLHSYGMKKWRDVFGARQLFTLGVFVTQTRNAISRIAESDPEQAEGIAAMLTILFGRFVDYMSLECRWEGKNGEIKNTFSRFAMPMIWDVAEANPFTESARFYIGGANVATKVVEHLLFSSSQSKSPKPAVKCESAIKIDGGSYAVVMTDPPYYDAIPYSDLMDFFFVWQRRILAGFNFRIGQTFGSLKTPKWDADASDGELIDDETRFGGDRDKSKRSYEDGMGSAFRATLNSLQPDGRLVVVFANKQVDAWETLIGALVKGGAVVTASWPIQTEMPNKVTQQRANLSSSVWIVCRKRLADAPPGWDEQVLEAMESKLFAERPELGDKNILQYYFDQGIIGPDFLWAALGPALEAYSAHPFVRKADGSGAMSVADFLGEVRKLVLQFAMGRLLHAEGLDLDAVTQFYLLHRSTFGIDPASAGACILYAMSCGKNLGELQIVWRVLAQGGKKKKQQKHSEADDADDDAGVAETKGNELILVDWQERGSNDDIGEPKGGQPSPLIDRVQRLMVLLHQGQSGEVQQLFNQWALASEPAFKPLLQALRELALRDKQDLECRMVEALATTLNMNTRRIVTPEGVVQETPLFESVEIETRSPGSVKYPAKQRKKL